MQYLGQFRRPVARPKLMRCYTHSLKRRSWRDLHQILASGDGHRAREMAVTGVVRVKAWILKSPAWMTKAPDRYSERTLHVLLNESRRHESLTCHIAEPILKNYSRIPKPYDSSFSRRFSGFRVPIPAAILIKHGRVSIEKLKAP